MRLLFSVILLVSGQLSVGSALAAPPLQQSIQSMQIKEQPAAEARQVSLDQYLSTLSQQSERVASCRLSAAGCDPAKVGDDLQVSRGSSSFRAGFDWLRITLSDARKANDADRVRVMSEAATRLQEDAAEAGAASPAGNTMTEARAKTDAILNRPEFRIATPNNWLLRQWQTLLARIAQALESAASRIPHSSSLALIIEWSLLGLAAVGLLLWAWRSMRQQRLAVAAPVQARDALWQKASDDWARLAEAEAAAGHWRDAVHCLYWAAIVMLEGRRMWRANRARTPREYLPLLESGSARQTALGGLTRIFERVWYGLRPASRGDFERAQALVDELKAA